MKKSIFEILISFFKHPIGKRRPVKTLYRFISWQILSRLNLSKPTFHFIENTSLHINRGQTIATGNYYLGLLEFEEMSFLLHFLNAGDTFFDIGANVGVYSILASGVCHAKTFAFEPVPETYSILEKNIRLNGLEDKISAHAVGIAETKKNIRITSDLNTQNHILSEHETSNHIINIEVKTLDEFKKEKPVMLKIDVEGYEKYVLAGARTILSSDNLVAIIVEVNKESERYNIAPSEIHDLLTGFNFQLYYYAPFKKELIQTDFPYLRDNRIYIKNIDFVNNKLQNAKTFSVFGISV